MSSGTVLLTVLIALWAVLEYRRRERKHSERLRAIRGGNSPAAPAGVTTVWKLLGEALLVLVLTTSAFLAIRGALADLAASWVLTGMGVLFAAMTVLVLLMLVRDIRTWKFTRPGTGYKP